jgi:DNA polymerase III epsilon subunit-like protein
LQGDDIVLSGLALCIDLETTGVKPGYDEIVELALVLFSYDQNGIIDIKLAKMLHDKEARNGI